LAHLLRLNRPVRGSRTCFWISAIIWAVAIICLRGRTSGPRRRTSLVCEFLPRLKLARWEFDETLGADVTKTFFERVVGYLTLANQAEFVPPGSLSLNVSLTGVLPLRHRIVSEL
jgi:hypothetical protein